MLVFYSIAQQLKKKKKSDVGQDKSLAFFNLYAVYLVKAKNMHLRHNSSIFFNAKKHIHSNENPLKRSSNIASKQFNVAILVGVKVVVIVMASMSQ